MIKVNIPTPSLGNLFHPTVSPVFYQLPRVPSGRHGGQMAFCEKRWLNQGQRRLSLESAGFTCTKNKELLMEELPHQSTWWNISHLLRSRFLIYIYVYMYENRPDVWTSQQFFFLPSYSRWSRRTMGGKVWGQAWPVRFGYQVTILGKEVFQIFPSIAHMAISLCLRGAPKSKNFQIHNESFPRNLPRPLILAHTDDGRCLSWKISTNPRLWQSEPVAERSSSSCYQNRGTQFNS